MLSKRAQRHGIQNWKVEAERWLLQPGGQASRSALLPAGAIREEQDSGSSANR